MDEPNSYRTQKYSSLYKERVWLRRSFPWHSYHPCWYDRDVSYHCIDVHNNRYQGLLWSLRNMKGYQSIYIERKNKKHIFGLPSSLLLCLYTHSLVVSTFYHLDFCAIFRNNHLAYLMCSELSGPKSGRLSTRCTVVTGESAWSIVWGVLSFPIETTPVDMGKSHASIHELRTLEEKINSGTITNGLAQHYMRLVLDRSSVSWTKAN